MSATETAKKAPPPTADVDLLPASFSQRRLWFLDRLEPNNPAYLISSGLRLKGRLERGILGRALDDVIARHEVLRTSITAIDGNPTQVVHPPMGLGLAEFDLTDLPDDVKWRATRQHARDAAAQPFDLETAPLVRGRLLKLAEDDHVLLITMHHIVSDGWSVGIFARDLSAFYKAAVEGRPPQLPDLAIQFGDYAAWQEELLSGPRVDSLIESWRTMLDGASPLLTLPTDRPRPRRQSFNGAAERFDLPAELTAALKEIGRRYDATLLMTLITAFGVLLGRLAGQTDVVVGTPVANRNRSELEPLIGFFVNLLPLRVRFDDSPTFAELLKRVRETALDAYSGQDMPFERLVEALAPARDLAHSPLFQTMLNLQNLPEAKMELPGLVLEPMDQPDRTAKFDLTLTVYEADGRLEGGMEYNSDIFKAETIRHWLAALRAMLTAAAATPDLPVDRLPLLDAAERRAVIAACGGPIADIPQWPVHAEILRRADAHPGRPAVSACGDLLTYGQLAAKIRGVAARLRHAGVAAGNRVAVLVERNVDLPAILLGVHAAGAAYVPLDPIYPAERLRMMIEDSGAVLLLTGRRQVSLIETTLPILLADDIAVPLEPADIPPISASPPSTENDLRAPPPEPDGDAYVIFTSGSTGRPKGVVVGHRALANFMASMAGDPGMSEDDTLLAVTTVSFDIAALELFLPLWCGARVAIASRDETTDGERLSALMTATMPTIMQATPMTWRMLRATGWRGGERFRALCGGEALPGDLAADLAGAVGRLWNLYGPTETTIWSSLHEVKSTPAARSEDSGPVPIGRPIANTRMFVLDPWMEPVPAGAPGELFIGGAGLAQGYEGRPDLTAERFVADPFAHGEERLYRTGDLARRRGDGVFEYLGRADQQVKLRGFRIELEEIETTLRRRDDVADAAVVLSGAGGAARLAAFVVTAAGPTPTVEALRETLRRRLPDYMIPPTFVFVDSLPRTANGKIDRKALALRAVVGARGAVEPIAPRNDTEKRLATVWADVLERADIGINEDFFEAGGHSLLAIRLIAQVNGAFGRNLPLTTLFQSPTVAGMAAILEDPEQPQERTTTVTLADGPRQTPLFVFPGAGGDPAYLIKLAGLMDGQRQLISFQAPGLDGAGEPLRSMEAYAACYLPGIRAAQPRGPYCFLGHSFGSHVAFEVSRRLREQGDAVARFIVIDTVAPVLDHNPIDTERDSADWIAEMAAIVSVMLGRKVEIDSGYLRAHEEDEQIQHLATAMIRAGWLTPNTTLPLLRGQLNVYREALSIFYRPTARLPIDAVLLKADASAEATGFPELSDPSITAVLSQRAWGWEELCSKPVRIHHLPGNHNSVVFEPHVRTLAKTVLTELSDVR